MTQSALSIRNICRNFGGLVAVDDVSLEVAPHAITTVIGPNGAGKSTLFNLVSGAFSPSSGSVYVGALDVTHLPPHKRQKAGIARSFQITNAFFSLTVAENIRLAAQALEPRWKLFMPVAKSHRARAKVDEVIKRFKFGDKASELAGNLSHGEQRRLEIAMCLACEPSVLMLDEPTQGMSHHDTQQTADLIRELTCDVSIMLVEHDINLVMSLSDHVVVMHQGRKLAEGPPQQVRENAAVQAAYFGQH